MTTATTPATAPAMATGGRGRWLGLAMLSLGVSMIIVDATIVNVAVPSIIRDLNLDSTAAEWINAIYTLVFAALLVTMGRMGDVLGRRAMYLAGLVIFVLASMVAGLSTSGEMLIGARLVQGIGGAMILPATQSILNANFQGRDRAIAFGIWGAVIGGMAAVGPLLGGWLTTNLSWNWAFYINLPIGILAILGTLRYIRESRDEHTKLGFDLPGFILITVGLVGVIFGLIEGRSYGWWAPNPDRVFAILGWSWPSDAISVVPVSIGIGVVALLLFAAVEVRRQRAGKFYLFDFSLWRFRAFRFGNLAGTIVSLGEFGLLFALPLFLQAVVGYDAFQTGLIFLALAVGSFFAAPLSATLARRWGPRRAVTLGMGLEAVGIFFTTVFISPSTSGLLLAIPLFVYGVGVGLATAQLTSIVLSDIPPERSGLASGTNSTMRQVGSALGVAILGTVLFVTLVGQTEANLAAAVPDMPATCQRLLVTLVDESAGQILPALRDPASAVGQAGDFGGSLSPEQAACFADPAFVAALPATVTPIEDAFTTAAHVTGFTALGFVTLGVVFSLLLPDTRHREEEVEIDEPVAPAAAAGA
ncbi:MAG: DHA2 family efflux MFS transporter permease subunit [Chloroflexi bacterium]|jgi:EmrB/QacA subfamily drug resistance transporter|nr:DHA2 family efflux MFS transporter permease subunit [Chloroflexota bacterium]